MPVGTISRVAAATALTLSTRSPNASMTTLAAFSTIGTFEFRIICDTAYEKMGRWNAHG